MEKVFKEKYRPSPIPKGGLEIMLSAKLRIGDERRIILEHFKIIQSNYLENADTDARFFISFLFNSISVLLNFFMN